VLHDATQLRISSCHHFSQGVSRLRSRDRDAARFITSSGCLSLRADKKPRRPGRGRCSGKRYGCYAGVTATVTPEIDRPTCSLGPLVTLLHLY
jgi:hypothetical protein